MNFSPYSFSGGLGPSLKRRGERGIGGLGRPLYCTGGDRRKSKVWNYYTQLSETHVECNVCKRRLSFHNSTTTMREHLVRKHSIRDSGPLPSSSTVAAPVQAQLIPPTSFPGNSTAAPAVAPGCMSQPVVSLVVKEEQDADITPESGEAKRTRTTCAANSVGGATLNSNLLSSHEQDPLQPSLSGYNYSGNSSAGNNRGNNNSDTAGTRGCSHKRAALLTELILEMVFRDLQPLSVVEERGFRLLLGCLEPLYPAPSPSQLGSLLWHRYQILKQHLEQHLQVSLSPRCLAICTERWRSLAGCGVGGVGRLYLTVSAHFIDKDWRLARCILETRPIPDIGEETGELDRTQLGDTLRAVLSEFRLPENFVFCVVHDTPWVSQAGPGNRLTQGGDCLNRCQTVQCSAGPSHASFQNLPAGWVPLLCAGEALKLCVQEGLEAEPVRQALAAARGIASHFQHNLFAAAALNHKAEAANKASARLVLDDTGRWATAIDMCESLLELKWVVSSVLEEQKATPNLADHQWRLLQELVPVLKTVRIAAAFLAEDTNAPISALMPCLHGVSRLLSQRIGESACPVARGVMERVQAGMEQRWKLGDQEILLESPAVLSSFLDPRFKELRFLSPNTRSKLHDRVKELLSTQAYVEDGEEHEQAEEDEEEEEEDNGREGSTVDLGLGLSDAASGPRTGPLDSPVSCGSAEEGDIIMLQQQSVPHSALICPTLVSDLNGTLQGTRVNSQTGLTSPKADVQPGAPERASPAAQSMYDILLGEDPTERMPEIHQQLENYIAEPLCKRSLSPLHWWRAKEHRFPAVARLARKYLAIPATAVPADRAFATREAPAAQRRATLGPQHLDHILFLHQNSDYVEYLKDGNGQQRDIGSTTSHGSQQTRETLYQSLVSYENKAWVGGEEL
ncbi:hypothetical protein GJAV_G00132360 [Gymnothorax javanicus]|nr:hypothetical protein GJAV_G00132360 [Gymnothorax javanicus]